jgi:hypothetical protein
VYKRVIVRCVHCGLLGAIVNRWRGPNEKEETEVDGAKVLLSNGGLLDVAVVIFKALNYSSMLSELRRLLVYGDVALMSFVFSSIRRQVIAQTNRAKSLRNISGFNSEKILSSYHSL